MRLSQCLFNKKNLLLLSLPYSRSALKRPSISRLIYPINPWDAFFQRVRSDNEQPELITVDAGANDEPTRCVPYPPRQ